MRVLIISEDHTNDQYMLKPIIEAMLQSIGKTQVTVRVCQERFQGIAEVLDWTKLRSVVERHRGKFDLLLICVDRDNEETRRASLDDIEKRAEEVAPNCVVLAENAWQEIEVWVLAGHELPKQWNWKEIRSELHPKERYFLPFAQQRGVHKQTAGGRMTLANEAARQYKRIKRLCKEDIASLENRIAQRIKP